MSTLPLAQTTPDTIVRLSGRTLAVARSLWLVVSVAATLTFLFALPIRVQVLTHPSPTNLANLNALGMSSDFFAAYVLVWEILTGAIYAVVGFVIFWRGGDERLALLAALVLIVFGVGNGSLTPTIHSLLGVDPSLDLLVHTFEFIAWFGIGLFFYLFPNGRFVPGWTRWLALAWLSICIVWNYAGDTPLAPLNWSPWLFAPTIGLFWFSWAYSQIYRYRRASTAVERQQTKWVVSSVSVIIFIMLVVSVIGAFVPGYDLMSEEQLTPAAFAYMFVQWPLSLAIASLPVAIASSILRYRLWDIDNLISRALVYGALTAFVVAAYILVVGALGALFQSSGNMLISLLATGIIALLFNPVRERLQRLVNRLIYGERDDPYTVLSRLSQNLQAALVPDSVLNKIVETIAQTLKLPYAAIVLRDTDTVQVAAAYGTPSSRALAFPLTYQHQLVGELHVASRAPDEPFTASERRLLEDIAAQTGIAVHNLRLTADLQLSREQLVGAREEERRRLRRDLHDGLGPRLAGQTLKLEAALDSLDGSTETARALLQETMTESQTVIAEIRRLVYGLRPPALDQLGLLSAIREQAAQYQVSGLQVTVSLSGTLPPLAAAVEVAAYRIIQEALTNVARHARATSATVSLALGRDLEIEVVDNGMGLPLARTAGVGLSSMRERAEEIGGSCVIESGATGGTRVFARLPLNHPIAPH